MVDIYEICKDWEAGKISIDEANEKLSGSGVYLDPKAQEIAEGESAVHYADVTKINGFARLDTGTGTLDKVEIKDGKLVNCDVGEMFALVIFADGSYHEVDGDHLAIPEE